MILCTVKDDLHDIGKNIVRSKLEAGGFDVLDLGIDAPAQKIVDTAKAEGIQIIALSGVLTPALNAMRSTIQTFRDAGIRDNVKSLVGGCPVTADEWAFSPQKNGKALQAVGC